MQSSLTDCVSECLSLFFSGLFKLLVHTVYEDHNCTCASLTKGLILMELKIPYK